MLQHLISCLVELPQSEHSVDCNFAISPMNPEEETQSESVALRKNSPPSKQHTTKSGSCGKYFFYATLATLSVPGHVYKRDALTLVACSLR